MRKIDIVAIGLNRLMDLRNPLPEAAHEGNKCSNCGKELAYNARSTRGICSNCVPNFGYSSPRSVRRAASRVDRIGRRGRKARRIIQRAVAVANQPVSRFIRQRELDARALKRQRRVEAEREAKPDLVSPDQARP